VHTPNGGQRIKGEHKSPNMKEAKRVKQGQKNTVNADKKKKTSAPHRKRKEHTKTGKGTQTTAPGSSKKKWGT